MFKIYVKTIGLYFSEWIADKQFHGMANNAGKNIPNNRAQFH